MKFLAPRFCAPGEGRAGSPGIRGPRLDASRRRDTKNRILEQR